MRTFSAVPELILDARKLEELRIVVHVLFPHNCSSILLINLTYVYAYFADQTA